MDAYEIDLHGLRHEDVRRFLIKEIEYLRGTGTIVNVVTGHSTRMKKIAGEVLDEYKLSYQEGDWLGRNQGMLRTVI